MPVFVERDAYCSGVPVQNGSKEPRSPASARLSTALGSPQWSSGRFAIDSQFARCSGRLKRVGQSWKRSPLSTCTALGTLYNTHISLQCSFVFRSVQSHENGVLVSRVRRGRPCLGALTFEIERRSITSNTWSRVNFIPSRKHIGSIFDIHRHLQRNSKMASPIRRRSYTSYQRTTILSMFLQLKPRQLLLK